MAWYIEVAATAPPSVWNRSDARIREALRSLASQISRERSTLRWTVNASRHKVKPLHLVMTLELSQRPNDSLVYSVMYTSWKRTTVRYCDLMIENGQILARLSDEDLGLNPSDARIEQSVDEVVEFIATCKDPILRALPDVP